ncbi:MAG: hypothetical protein ACRD5J_18685, partial [Nitrososphaeraceae archaeon]
PILPAFISYLSGTTINEVQSSTANLRNWYPSPLQNSKPHWNMAVMKCPPQPIWHSHSIAGNNSALLLQDTHFSMSATWSSWTSLGDAFRAYFHS